MKKLLAVLVAALVIALALWMALRVQQANRQMQVSELLPKTTLLLAEMLDLKRTQAQWRASDLYALWHEPALQAWLEKPLAELRQRRGNWSEAEHFVQLEPTNLFLALASLENNDPRFVVGFHFAKSEAEVRRFIENREAPWLAKSGSSKREVINYQEHQIETVNAGRFALATVFDRNWFFASNHLAALKTLLDRADRRTPTASNDALRESEAFQTATKQLPKDFAGMFFVDPRPFFEKLAPLLAMTGQTAVTSRIQQFQKIRTVAGAMGFDHGKMRETLYVAVPQQHPAEKLTRSSLAGAGKETFLYSAALASWPDAWAATTNKTAGEAMPPVIQNMLAALTRAGVSREDLGQAFGNELEVAGEWPENAHWPQVVLMLPVKDGARAQKVIGALDLSAVLGSEWTRTEKDGVSFYNMNAIGGIVPIHPTIALSSRMLLAASDPAAAEAAILPQTTKPAEALEKTAAFKEAEARVGTAETAFNYIDTRLIFERTDAALRPLLLMSATFYPALGKKVDVSKIPPAEVIAKHLSPIVMSQRYTGDGYVTESVGPVTFTEATLGLGTAFAAGYVNYQRGFAGLVPPAPAVAPVAPTPAPIPTPP